MTFSFLFFVKLIKMYIVLVYNEIAALSSCGGMTVLLGRGRK